MAVDLKAATPDTTMAAGAFLFGADSQAAAAPSVYAVQNVADYIASVLPATITAGGMAFTVSNTNKTYVANAANNVIEATVQVACILGGGQTGFPNLIGSTGLPTGTDFSPTGWSADSGYVAGAATVGMIGGGYDNVVNQIAGGIYSGGHNFVKYDAEGHSIIGGGSYNVVAAGRSGIFCGRRNTITGAGVYNFIGGGDDNNITGSYGTIAGGRSNAAVSYAFAAGRRAKANFSGAFALADSTDADFSVTTSDTFGARFTNGYWFTGGNVGIGKTAPGVKVDVSAALGADGTIARFTDSISVTALDIRFQTALSGLATKHIDLVGQSSTSDMLFSPSSDTRGSIVLKDGGNVGIRTASQFGSGTGGVIGIADCTGAPSTNATGGGVLYSESGALKWRGSGGTVTILGAA